MRISVSALAVAMALLAGCGGSRPAPELSSRSMPVEVTPRYGDHKPHEWPGRAPWHYMVHGVDVSKWQGDVDWNAVRTSGASFAFIKATEGADHSDDMFLANWRAAAAAGMPRGAYHFYYFCRTANEQAAWFIRNVPKERGSLPPVLDMEWNHQSRTCPQRPAPQVVRAEMDAYLNAVERHYGRRPVIYVTPDFYAENELWRMAGEAFWLRSVANHPSVVYPGQDWHFWQYTGTGMVPGIAGRADINAFAGTPGQWRAWLARNSL